MAYVPQPLAQKRKSPTQARSKATVLALVEAAAQILEKRGEAAVTTKTVAERAGVSIGTLYQYFDDRDSLLMAVADRERERLARELRSHLEAAGAERSRDALRQYIRMLVRSFVRRRGARRQFELMTALSFKAKADPTFTELIADQLRQSHPQVPASVIEANAFVLAYGLQGALRAAAIRDSPLLREPAFEDALCHVVRALVPSRDIVT